MPAEDTIIEEISASPEIYTIGNGFQKGRVFEAVKAGFTIGRSL